MFGSDHIAPNNSQDLQNLPLRNIIDICYNHISPLYKINLN